MTAPLLSPSRARAGRDLSEVIEQHGTRRDKDEGESSLEEWGAKRWLCVRRGDEVMVDSSRRSDLAVELVEVLVRLRLELFNDERVEGGRVAGWVFFEDFNHYLQASTLEGRFGALERVGRKDRHSAGDVVVASLVRDFELDELPGDLRPEALLDPGEWRLTCQDAA